jgi:deoxyribodipyrimidine photo-lyase
MTQQSPVIVWFRQDLRLIDNPALEAAIATDSPILPVYIFDEETSGLRPRGGASKWWLHLSLKALDSTLQAHDSQLLLKRGPAAAILEDLIKASGSKTVFWNRCYDLGSIARDAAIKKSLKDQGIAAQSFNSALLIEPWDVKTGAGGSFKVFSPFWRALSAAYHAMPLHSLPKTFSSGPKMEGEDLDDWGLLPAKPDWAGGLRETWQPGEAGAQAALTAFTKAAIENYGEDRNRPDKNGTSRLSPHLHWGEIGPRQLWAALTPPEKQAKKRIAYSHQKGAEAYLREIGWREFSYHLLYYFPDLPERCIRQEFAHFPYHTSPVLLRAWQRGLTGYPIVDAGMRELWHTGWMHNRVRMIAASFLIKDLLISWREGEAWFWDTLVDADLANNAASWQWVAGCGADAAPYFRIFNPVLQSLKFDPEGGYIRKYVPELARLPDKYIHAPWEAPDLVLQAAGVELGKTYPHRIADHAQARDKALKAYDVIKTKAQ